MWKLLEIGKYESFARSFPAIEAIVRDWKPEMLVIENQYLPSGPEGDIRFRAVSELVAARAMITAVFLLTDSSIQYRLVEPLTWQRSLGGSGLGRDRLKRRSILKASHIAGEKIEDHNVADAINMGHWFVTINRLAGKTGERVG
jgi:hypothetical protein